MGNITYYPPICLEGLLDVEILTLLFYSVLWCFRTLKDGKTFVVARESIMISELACGNNEAFKL